MPSFEDLPAELHDQIFGYTISCDKFVITSKRMRKNGDETPSRLTSRLTLAFASSHLRPRYRRFLEDYITKHANVVRVSVVDYGFNNFMQFLKDRIAAKELSTGEATFKRFQFANGGANPLDQQDLEGPYFAANIMFTRNFDGGEERLRRYVIRTRAMEKAGGHLRVFYKVMAAEESSALEEMLGGRLGRPKEETGQLGFLKKALGKKFTPLIHPWFDSMDVEQGTREALEESDINRGRVEDDYQAVNTGAGDEAGQEGMEEDAPGLAGQALGQQDPLGAPVQMPQANAATFGGLPPFMPPPPPPQPAAAPFGGLPAYAPPASALPNFAPHTTAPAYPMQPGFPLPQPNFAPIPPPPHPYSAFPTTGPANGFAGYGTATLGYGGDTDMGDSDDTTQRHIKAEPEEDEQKVDMGWRSYAVVPPPRSGTPKSSGGPNAFVPLLPAPEF